MEKQIEHVTVIVEGEQVKTLVDGRVVSRSTKAKWIAYKHATGINRKIREYIMELDNAYPKDF